MPLEVAFAKLTYTGEVFAQPPGVAASAPARPAQPQPQAKPAAGSGLTTANVLKSEKGQLDLTPVPKGIAGEDDGNAEEIEEIREDLPLSAPALPETLDLTRIKRCWDTLTFAVSRERMSLATYLQEGTPLEFKDGRLTIGFPPKCAFQKEALEDQNIKQLVAKVFSAKLETPVSLHYELIGNFKPQEEEGIVKEALNTFNGKVVSRWHKE